MFCLCLDADLWFVLSFLDSGAQRKKCIVWHVVSLESGESIPTEWTLGDQGTALATKRVTAGERHWDILLRETSPTDRALFVLNLHDYGMRRKVS